ncbi:MAG: hypothetical protein KGL39_27785 [Patescibacteria group bacterium]|nr:hypothetical protein [Patescibacteria group bacterium]
MPTILPLATLLNLANNAGKLYYDLVRHNSTIDDANSDAQAILSGLATDLASSDPAHFAALVPYISGIYGVVPGESAPTSSFGSVAGIGAGSFGAGQGLLNRASILSGAAYAFFEGLRSDLAKYGSALSISDLSTYAAYQNALSAYSCLFNPDTAALYWYAYNEAKLLAAACVFAPQGIVLSKFILTGAGAGNFYPGTYATANSLTAYPLAAYCGSVTVTAANTCTTSGLTGTGNNAVAYVSTAITGGTGSTLTITVTDSNGNTFSAVLDAAAAGTIKAFTPTVSGTVMATPVSATCAGTATGGVVEIIEGGPTTDAYGNDVYPGGLPMAQGFAPLKNTLIAVTADTDNSVDVTVTAPNQAGVSKTWITSIAGAQTAGYSTAMTVGAGTAGASDRIYATPTDVSVSGAATSGTIDVQSGSPERA